MRRAPYRFQAMRPGRARLFRLRLAQAQQLLNEPSDAAVRDEQVNRWLSEFERGFQPPPPQLPLPFGGGQ